MTTAVFSAQPADRRLLEAANASRHRLSFFESRLSSRTAHLASGFAAVCAALGDSLDRPCLELLHAVGVRYIALRCAGSNNIDLTAARELGFSVVRVPAYLPEATAEHAAGLILALQRKRRPPAPALTPALDLEASRGSVRAGASAAEVLKAYLLSPARQEVEEDEEDLLAGPGIEAGLRGQIVGVVGAGQVGARFIKLMLAFGCHVVACDAHPVPEVQDLPVILTSLPELFAISDIVSLHYPNFPSKGPLITRGALAQFKPGAMLINTSRGGVVDMIAVIEALRSGRLGAFGLDIYEDEAALLFAEYNAVSCGEDPIARLISFPNVVVTGHQAFFEREALENIASTTVNNLSQLEETGACVHTVLRAAA